MLELEGAVKDMIHSIPLLWRCFKDEETEIQTGDETSEIRCKLLTE